MKNSFNSRFSSSVLHFSLFFVVVVVFSGKISVSFLFYFIFLCFNSIYYKARASFPIKHIIFVYVNFIYSGNLFILFYFQLLRVCVCVCVRAAGERMLACGIVFFCLCSLCLFAFVSLFCLLLHFRRYIESRQIRGKYKKNMFAFQKHISFNQMFILYADFRILNDFVPAWFRLTHARVQRKKSVFSVPNGSIQSFLHLNKDTLRKNNYFLFPLITFNRIK